MNKVILKHIEINNFKGIASASFDFEEETEFYAENGSGKSTIKNAFEWILCQNVADVLPKLDNKEIPNLITSVSATISVNGVDYNLTRESKGKYLLNKDTGKLNKTTNEGKYQIDGMEFKEKDYKEKIASLLTNGVFENLQILTDKEYFNTDTTKFKWTDRRKILFDMCGVKGAVETIIKKPQYKHIEDYIFKGYATSDIKSMLTKEKRVIKEGQEKCNILIEQKTKENNELLKTDFNFIEKELKEKQEKYADLIASTQKEKQSKQIEDLQEQIFALTKEKVNLETDDLQEKTLLRQQMQEHYNMAQNLKFQYSVELDKIGEFEKEYKTKIEDNAECPVCHNKLKKEQIEQSNEEIEENNNTVDLKIKAVQDKIQGIREQHAKEEKIFKEIKDKLDNFKDNERIKELDSAIILAKSTIEQAKDKELTDLSIETISALKDEISGLQMKLRDKDYIEKNNASIKEWKEDNLDRADAIMKIEQQERELESYVKEQTDIVVETVNSHFSNGVSWALYNETYKGGEGGIEEDCVCMYNGKVYSSLSMGERNKANLEVVKTLQDYFGTNITIFSDNQEANTLPFDSAGRQIIKLYAEKGRKLEGVVKVEDIYKKEV